MRREFGLFSFEGPPHFHAQTLVMVGPPIANGATPNIVLSRLVRPPSEPFEAVAWRTLLDAAKDQQDFALFESSRTQVASRPAMRVRFKTVGERGVSYQTAVFVESPDGDVVSVTCSILHSVDDPPVLENDWAPALEHLLASMIVKGTAPPEPSRPKIASSPPEPMLSVGPVVPMPGDRRRASDLR
jgi:hypothetical protein